MMLEDPVLRRRFFGALALFGALILGGSLALIIFHEWAKPMVVVAAPAPLVQSPLTTVVPAPPRTTPPTVPETLPAGPAPVARFVAVRLGTKDFAAACKQQRGENAIAKITPNASEPPSYWLKCFIDGANVGGVSLDQYCSTIRPGTHSDNPRRYDPSETAWQSWECIPA
jgi:hypothetical protein